jgi:hypothetical protein
VVPIEAASDIGISRREAGSLRSRACRSSSGQQRHHRHHHRDSAPLALATGAADPGTDALADAGGGQRAGDHEHRGHDDGGFAGEAGQRLLAVQHAGQGQRQQDQHRGDIDPQLLADEQVQATDQDQAEGDLRPHQGGVGQHANHCARRTRAACVHVKFT